MLDLSGSLCYMQLAISSCFTSQASSALSRNYAKLSKRPDSRPQCCLAYDKSQSTELAKEDSPAIPHLVQIAQVDLALPSHFPLSPCLSDPGICHLGTASSAATSLLGSWSSLRGLSAHLRRKGGVSKDGLGVVISPVYRKLHLGLDVPDDIDTLPSSELPPFK